MEQKVTKQLNLLVLCGGQSTEHEISIISASNIINTLSPKKYNIIIVYITLQGAWHVMTDQNLFLDEGPQACLKSGAADPVTVALGDHENPLISLHNANKRYAVDCVFPVLHGTRGEDGAPQGLCDMLDVPYVGAGVLGSAVSMEKHITKQLLDHAGLAVTPWLLVYAWEWQDTHYQQLSNDFGSTLFIKPVSLGSSVGIAKVNNETNFNQALRHAFKFDDRVIVEPAIIGREIECSVLGNEKPVASLPGEIMTQHDFYSYEAKYCDPNGAQTVSPANLPEHVIENIQKISVQAFRILEISGMARVDFFVLDDDILINEVNTIPGFTDISMYPKNWEVSGLEYPTLLDNLIDLALQRHQKRKQLLIHMPQSEFDTDQQVAAD